TKPGLVPHRDAERAGLRELRARILASEDRVGLRAHGRRDPSAPEPDEPLRFLPSHGECSGEHECLSGERSSRRAAALRWTSTDASLLEAIHEPSPLFRMEKPGHARADLGADPRDLLERLLIRFRDRGERPEALREETRHRVPDVRDADRGDEPLEG